VRSEAERKMRACVRIKVQPIGSREPTRIVIRCMGVDDDHLPFVESHSSIVEGFSDAP
jgi:hypothetical protein